MYYSFLFKCSLLLFNCSGQEHQREARQIARPCYNNKRVCCENIFATCFHTDKEHCISVLATITFVHPWNKWFYSWNENYTYYYTYLSFLLLGVSKSKQKTQGPWDHGSCRIYCWTATIADGNLCDVTWAEMFTYEEMSFLTSAKWPISINWNIVLNIQEYISVLCSSLKYITKV